MRCLANKYIAGDPRPLEGLGGSGRAWAGAAEQETPTLLKILLRFAEKRGNNFVKITKSAPKFTKNTKNTKLLV